MNKKALFNFLRIFVSAGLVLFLFWIMRDSIGDVASTIKRANRPLLLVSFLLFAVTMGLFGIRLRTIMKAQNLAISLKEIVHLTFVGHFFNNFLPTTAGGDIVKAYYVSKKTGRKLHSVACILLDRLLGIFTFVIIVLIVALFVKGVFISKIIKIFLVATISGFFIIGIVLFSKRVAKKVPLLDSISRLFKAEEKMKGLYDLIYNYKAHLGLLLTAIAISLLLQSGMFCSIYLIIRSLGFSIPLKNVFLLMPIIATASMAPSINGLGVRESAFVFFFSPLVGKEGAFAISLLWLGVNFCVSLIGGGIYILSKQYGIGGMRIEGRSIKT